jgi:hypothetical protein
MSRARRCTSAREKNVSRGSPTDRATLEISLNRLRRLFYAGTAMPVDVVNTVTINRPIADVSGYAADPDLWYVNIKSVEWKTPRQIQPGAAQAAS